MGIIPFASTMKVSLILLSFLVASCVSVPSSPKGLTCTICTDVPTDLGNFITDDTTEQQIVDFAKELCHLLGTILGETIEADCNAMFEDNLPGIIDGTINDIDPVDICSQIGMCP